MRPATKNQDPRFTDCSETAKLFSLTRVVMAGKWEAYLE